MSNVDVRSHTKHCVILPSYNSGAALPRTAKAVADLGYPVWIVIDASTDGSSEKAKSLADDQLDFLIKVIELDVNCGKGGAVIAGMRAAHAAGFTHALVMDADGQHAVNSVVQFMECSAGAPDTMVLGVPVFGPEAPLERVKGRRVGNWFAHLETLWLGIEDSLFGFRIYPIAPSLEILESIRTARRFDFDTELAVRLVWAGVRPVNLPSPVFYPAVADGGVTHFHYVRDNLLLIWTHMRLIPGMVIRLPKLLRLRRQWQ